MRNCDYANRSSQLIISDSARQILQRCSTRFTPTREAKTESLVQKKPWDFFLGKCSGKEKKSPAIDLDQNRVLPRERILHELTARSEEGDLDRNNFLGKSCRAEYLRLQRLRENWSSANWISRIPQELPSMHRPTKKKPPITDTFFVAASYFKFQGREDSHATLSAKRRTILFVGSL